MAAVLVAWMAVLVGAIGEAAATEKGEEVVLSGRVVELTDVLQQRGLKADAAPVARQVVVRADDGTTTPLLCDDASRALFEDARLRNRKAEVRGRRFPGLPYLLVTSFQIEEGGRLRTPEYYCEICTISSRYPVSCPCCQGPMVLRMKPDAP